MQKYFMKYRKKKIYFYFIYYFLTEMFRLTRFVFVQGGIFIVCCLFVIYFIGLIVSLFDNSYATALAIEFIQVPVTLVLIFYYVRQFAMEVYSKWLFLDKETNGGSQLGLFVTTSDPFEIHKKWAVWSG